MTEHSDLESTSGRDQHQFEAISLPPASGLESPEHPSRRRQTGRPFVGIIFRCCGIYSRIYRNREGSAYEGHCPRCGKLVRIQIAPDGVDARFFEAY